MTYIIPMAIGFTAAFIDGHMLGPAFLLSMVAYFAGKYTK
jgi:hypothetical protein